MPLGWSAFLNRRQPNDSIHLDDRSSAARVEAYAGTGIAPGLVLLAGAAGDSVFIDLLVDLAFGAGADHGAADGVGEMVHWSDGLSCALAVPASLFWRGHVFKPYWAGQAVAPGDYLRGMATVWTALAVGGIVSLSGCVATESLAPNVIPSMLSLILFLTMWPGGRAMVRRVGNAEDPGLYVEPN